jgi:hypothetical protein
MAHFTVRIELREATPGDQQRLDVAMEAAGYKRTVTDDSGLVFQLPTSEYDLIANGNVSQVLAHAERIAASVKPQPQPQVLITEGVYRAFSLLPAAARKPAPAKR